MRRGEKVNDVNDLPYPPAGMLIAPSFRSLTVAARITYRFRHHAEEIPAPRRPCLHRLEAGATPGSDIVQRAAKRPEPAARAAARP